MYPIHLLHTDSDAVVCNLFGRYSLCILRSFAWCELFFVLHSVGEMSNFEVNVV